MGRLVLKCVGMLQVMVLLVSCDAAQTMFVDYVTYEEVAALREGVTEKVVSRVFSPVPEFALRFKTESNFDYGVRLYMVRKGYFCNIQEGWKNTGSAMACSLDEDPTCTRTCVEPQQAERRLMLVYKQPEGDAPHTLLSWGWIDGHQYERIGGQSLHESVFRGVDKYLNEIGCSDKVSLSECHF